MQTAKIQVEVYCSGTPEEQGEAQGAGLKGKIQGGFQALASLEGFRLRQPAWLPYRIYRWGACRTAWRLLAGPLIRDFPAMSRKMAGIAAGAAIDRKAVYLLNVLEPFLSDASGCTSLPGACSAVAVRGRRSATGEPMIARNFDYLPLIQPYYAIRESRPAGGFRSVDFIAAPLAGTVDGMNEAGLCITYNYAFTRDAPPTPTSPISMAIAEALQCCQTVTEAAERISARPRWGGAILMLADPTGDIASLELSSTKSCLRRPEAGEDALFHTNAFAGREMGSVEFPPGTVFNDRAPTPLRGRPMRHSSDLRDARFRDLLAGADALDADGLAAIMADHGPEGVPGDFTPCVHGSYWATTACLQFFPKSRRMRIAFDSACRARYEEIGLS